MIEIEGDNVKVVYRSLGAALVGASTVLVALWLSRSVLPSASPWFIPLEAESVTILLLVLGGGAVLARRGGISEAAALLAGAGAAWALSEVDPLILCQSDMLYRPCTVSEVAWMALPGLALGIASLVLFFYGLARPQQLR